MKKFKKFGWIFNTQRFNDGDGGAGAPGGTGGSGGGDGSGGAGGAGTGGAGSAGATGGQSGGGESTKPAVSFTTQDEYDNALKSAIGEHLKSLGIEKPDDLKGIVDDHKKRLEGEKSAEQKLIERDGEIKTANGTIQTLRVENAFIMEAIKQGVDPEKLSDAIRLADLSKVEVTDGGKIKGIDKHVTDLVTSKPWLKSTGTVNGVTPGAKPPAKEKSSIPNISDLRKMQRI